MPAIIGLECRRAFPIPCQGPRPLAAALAVWLAVLAPACEDGNSDRGPAGCAFASWPGGDPFADSVVLFAPGPGAGFGADRLPGVVLGPPQGKGPNAGSLDVVSLGREGTIVLGLDDLRLVDGPGPDLLVFENPFGDWIETGRVAVSGDGGATWQEWPCHPELPARPGCAGKRAVLASPQACVDPTDPATAGGDAFDLAEIGATAASLVRIRDSGANTYEGTSGGFDLDAIAVINGLPH